MTDCRGHSEQGTSCSSCQGRGKKRSKVLKVQLVVQLVTNVVFVQANTAHFALEHYALNVAGMAAAWSLEGI